MTTVVKIFIKFSLLLLVTSTTGVFAGVKEFNAAMAKGDFAAAAKETESVWTAFDKSKSAATTLAREFAYVNFMAGDFVQAKVFIDQLVDAKNKLTTPDDQPDISQLLAAAISYRLDNSSEHREKLVQTLKTRMLHEDTDVISIMVSEFLYQDGWSRQDWPAVAETAPLAADIVSRVGPEALERMRRAEVAGAVAGYLGNREDVKQYEAMVKLHNEIVADADKIQDDSDRVGVTQLKWRLQTWIANADALYTQFDYKMENPPVSFRSHSLMSSENGYFFEAVDATQNEGSENLPVCEYFLDTRKVFFPQSNDYQGQVGTVLFKMDVDKKGKVSNALALSSVPEDRYSMMMGFSSNSIKMKRKKGDSKKTCRLDQKNVVVPVSFEIKKEERRR